MAVEILNSGKQIQFDAYDTFEGVPESLWRGDPPAEGFTFASQEALRGPDGTLYDAAKRNLAPVAEAVTLHQGDAIAAADAYPDESVDFVFLDDNHDTPHVLTELTVWWPKLKPGGILAGHDYDWGSVMKAVTIWSLRYGRVVDHVSARSWACQKPIPATSWVVPATDRRCLVAVCCNERNVPTKTAESLIRLGWGQRVTSAAQTHGFTAVDFYWAAKRVLVSDLRDDAAFAALTGNYSHLLFLDADMTWPPDVLVKLLAHHSRGLVSGLYHLKAWPYWPVALKSAVWNEDDQDYDYTYDKDGPHSEILRPVSLIGMGCALIPVELFRRFDRPWFQYQQASSRFTTVTEDVYFCQQAERLGCPIWLDPTIVCRHVSQELISTAHYDRATFEMAMLANGQRLGLEQDDLVRVGRPEGAS
jgi:hypothetical protein